MGPGAFDQGNRRPRAPAEAIAEAGDEFEPRSTAADHDDAVQRRLARMLEKMLGARPSRVGARMQHAGCVICQKPRQALKPDSYAHHKFVMSVACAVVLVCAKRG